MSFHGNTDSKLTDPCGRCQGNLEIYLSESWAVIVRRGITPSERGRHAPTLRQAGVLAAMEGCGTTGEAGQLNHTRVNKKRSMDSVNDLTYAFLLRYKHSCTGVFLPGNLEQGPPHTSIYPGQSSGSYVSMR